jgi:SAM-dependent methyltransferase
MVAASDTAARKAGLAQSCKFVCADFMDLKLEERFEIVVAVGLFDYVGRPDAFLRKIAKVTAGVFLASFPSNRGLWKLQRAIRYNRIRGCEIHDYRAEQLLSLYHQAQFPSVHILPMKRGLFVVARKSENL